MAEEMVVALGKRSRKTRYPGDGRSLPKEAMAQIKAQGREEDIPGRRSTCTIPRGAVVRYL